MHLIKSRLGKPLIGVKWVRLGKSLRGGIGLGNTQYYIGWL